MGAIVYMMFLTVKFLFVVLCSTAPATALPNTVRRLLSNENLQVEWAREAQRNLSRFESQLLRHTLDKLLYPDSPRHTPYDRFNPIVTCPPPSRLMRLDPGGPVEKPTRWLDGAKWMCVPFPRTARQGCVVVSLGSNDQFEFEQAVLDMTPCSVHTFDCTTGMMGNASHSASMDPSRHTFHPLCVGGAALMAQNPSTMVNWEGLIKLVRHPTATGTPHLRPRRDRALGMQLAPAVADNAAMRSAAGELVAEVPGVHGRPQTGGVAVAVEAGVGGAVSSRVTERKVSVGGGGGLGSGQPNSNSNTVMNGSTSATNNSQPATDNGNTARSNDNNNSNNSNNSNNNSNANERSVHRIRRALLDLYEHQHNLHQQKPEQEQNLQRQLHSSQVHLDLQKKTVMQQGHNRRDKLQQEEQQQQQEHSKRNLAANRYTRRRDTGPEVLILKIDVEGYEWPLISEWGPHTPGLPTFLAIEIHNWMEASVLSQQQPHPIPLPTANQQQAGTWKWVFSAGEDKVKVAGADRMALQVAATRHQRVGLGELSLVFLHLARLGYAVVAREDNPNGDSDGRPCCSEFLFIRVRGHQEDFRRGNVDSSNLWDSLHKGLSNEVLPGVTK